MKKALLFGMIALLPFLSCPALELGDPAPPVKASTWLNGDAVNPAQPDGETIYVVEFWATWCPPCRKSIPHLNELQARLKDQKVVIIGITDETEDLAKPFVEKMDMKYLVAIDPDRETVDPYMKDVGGIPHAFVVDREGKIVWSGHPMAGLDDVLDQLLAGTYDMKAAQELQTIETSLQDLVVGGEYEKALAQVAKLMELGGPKMNYFQMQLGLLAQTGGTDQFPGVYQAMYTAFENSPEDLNTIAWVAATSPFKMCDLAAAWKAAHRAAELTEYKQANILDTLARVYYAMGRLDSAIAYQEKAVAASEGGEEEEDMPATLAYYQSALEAQKLAASTSEGKTEP